MNIPYFDCDGAGPPLHFLHANGYPPACYKGFMEHLQTQYYVFGMLLRPLWESSNPDAVQDWDLFSDDLLGFLKEKNTSPVIGVGHSIGATVTLRATLHDLINSVHWFSSTLSCSFPLFSFCGALSGRLDWATGFIL
jgi:pimeloyl-ACP methyl ester carboxylesterase